MKLSNFKKAYVFAAILLISFAFTACSSDNDHGYWVEGSVNFKIEPETGGDGLFEYGIRLDDRYIRDLGGRLIDPRYIENWRMIDDTDVTTLEITNLRFYGTGEILWFDVIVEGVSVYEYHGAPIRLLGQRDPAYIDDYDLYYVMEDAIAELIRKGKVDVTVRGEINLFNTYEPIYFDFYNGVEFYVRD